jgi:RNA polymerase sigma factor (sigma-70 family)
MHEELTDDELIAKYKETRDQKYVAVLHKRYKSLVLGTCIKYLKNKDDARDASADIYLELVTKLLDHEIKAFKSWLYILIRNHCLMKLRKNNPFKHEELDEDKNEGDFMESPSFEHLIEEGSVNLDRLSQGIALLDEKQRVCVEMFHLAEKSYKEIATATGWEIKQIKSYIQNGMRNLKNFFRSQGSSE